MSEEKQIEEMARFVCSSFHGHHDCENCSLYEERCCVSFCAARRLYNASYRKQSEGEWILQQNGKGVCSKCNRQDNIDELACFCRYCGARMGGGEE